MSVTPRGIVMSPQYTGAVTGGGVGGGETPEKALNLKHTGRDPR